MAVVTRADIDRIHERLTIISEAVLTNVEQCKPCRKIVMGNGQRAIGERLTMIESEITHLDEMRTDVTDLKATVRLGAWATTKLIAVTAAIAAVIGAVARWL